MPFTLTWCRYAHSKPKADPHPALFSLLLGGVVGIITRLPRKQVLTLSIEVGLHNSAIAFVIALSFLGMPALAVFSACYLVVEYIFSELLMTTMNSSIGTRFLGISEVPVPEN